MSETLLVGLASIVVLGIAAQWLGARLRVPPMLFLIALGVVFGPVLGWLNPGRLFGNLLQPLISLSVAVILFEGGLSLNFAGMRAAGSPIRNLVIYGFTLTWVLTAVAARFILGMSVELAFLLGAVLVVSGPTVIIPMLRQFDLREHIDAIVRWEGILIDPIGAMLALLVFSVIVNGNAGGKATLILAGILMPLATGLVIGAIGAGFLYLALKRYWVPDFLQGAFTLAVVLAAYAICDVIYKDSGLLAVTLMGVLIANQKHVPMRYVVEFKESLGVILISVLFILLSANLPASSLLHLKWRTLFFVAALVFVVRPFAVNMATLGSSLNWKERFFLSFIAPRGIIAASVAAVFGEQLAKQGMAQAADIVPVTFATIVVTVALYGLMTPFLGAKLGLAETNPQGALIMGANEIGRTIAAALREAGFRVVVCDTQWRLIVRARRQGLPAARGSLLSDVTLEQVDLVGLGKFLALTPNDDANSLATVRYAEVFQRAEVYQLYPEGLINDPKLGVSEPHLHGRYLFAQGLTHDRFSEALEDGAMIKFTKLTETFDFKAFRLLYGSRAIPLFVVSAANQLLLATVDAPLEPVPGQTVISLVLPSTEPAQAST